MHNLSNFSLENYGLLLKKLVANGYSYSLINDIKNETKKRTVFLRHDIDLHICMIEKIALLESSMNICSTYYVPLTLPFNVLYPENLKILCILVEMGHDIGLHYDLETYPRNYNKARKHLDWEVQVLSKIIGRRVSTISMHQPHKGYPDPFRNIDEYINPHDPRHQNGMIYVSDSCRAWRDETILSFLSPTPPKRILLATHPELWLDGTILDRISYIDEVLLKHGLNQYINYYDKYVRKVWLTHPSAKLHDERESHQNVNSNQLNKI